VTWFAKRTLHSGVDVHFVCSTFGSSGDVYPVLGLAVELQLRGHQVTFATSPHFEEAICRNGIDFEPLGKIEDYAEAINNPDLWHPLKSFPHVFRSLQPGLQRQYEIHSSYAGDPHVVGLSNCLGMGALIAHEKHGMPFITLHLQPAVIWSKYQPPSLPGLFGPRWLKNLLYGIGERLVIDRTVCPYLNPWRAELGLPPVRRVTRWWHSPYGVVCLFPEWFAPTQPDWPQPLWHADFPLWNDRSDEPLSQEVEAFLSQGSPPLVFTPGTANQHAAAFFETAVGACEQLGRRGILLTSHASQIPVMLPDTVAHFAYVPLDLLLPRAAAFVHHGGIGSTSQALLAGIPQVLMPLAHDQFDNAERITRLGVGTGIPAPQFTSDRLIQALQKLLEQESVLSKCRELSDRLQQRDGLSRTADAIENRVLNRSAR